MGGVGQAKNVDPKKAHSNKRGERQLGDSDSKTPRDLRSEP